MQSLCLLSFNRCLFDACSDVCWDTRGREGLINVTSKRDIILWHQEGRVDGVGSIGVLLDVLDGTRRERAGSIDVRVPATNTVLTVASGPTNLHVIDEFAAVRWFLAVGSGLSLLVEQGLFRHAVCVQDVETLLFRFLQCG